MSGVEDVNTQQAFQMSDPTVKVRLIAIAGLWGTFAYTNSFFKKTVRDSSKKNAVQHNALSSHTCTVLYMTTSIGCVYYVFQEQQLWNVFMFQLPCCDGGFWMVLWAVSVNDFVLKCVTVITKAFFSMAPIKPKNRGKYYMFVEHVMQLYRMVIPIVPWVHYLTDGRSWVFATGLRCFYFLTKGYKLPLKVIDVRNAFVSLVRKKAYGVKPKRSYLNKRGDDCPICQSDYKDPVMLDCKHIFCDNCVSVWFKRKQDCPMCRAKIYTGSSRWEDGFTSEYVQLY